MVAESNLSLVENNEVGVGEEMFSNFNIVAIIAEERCDDFEAFARLSQ